MEAKKLAGTILSVSCRTLVFVLVVLILFFTGRYMYMFGQDVFNEQAMASPGNAITVEVTIPDKSSVMDIAGILADNGLVKSKILFFTQAILSDYSDDFTPGTYTLSTDMKPTQIMAVIAPEPEEETEE